MTGGANALLVTCTATRLLPSRRRASKANNPLTHPVWRPQNSQILEDKEEAVPKKGSRKEGAEASGEVLVMATIWILK